MDKYKYRALCLLLVLSPLLWGVYYEWLSCLCSLALLIYLGVVFAKEGLVLIPQTPALAASAAVTLFMGISALWGVDKGMALIGMFKFLPLPLFAIATAQIGTEERDRLLGLVPLVGAVIVPVCAVLELIPALAGFFHVNGRLAGTFQYPNTFALYLLAGIVILLFKAESGRKNALCMVSLLAGIIASGSRTVFVMLVFTIVIFIFSASNRRIRRIFAGAVLGFLALWALYAAVTRDFSSAGRYLTISLSESTFVGRLLYFRDALPIILKHPFGLGYLGYHYLQGSFQTGVYSVVNIHNGLLQVLLDVGWFPAALCVAAAAKGLRRGRSRERALILLICFHCLFDFDLQFISVGFLLILTMDLYNTNMTAVKSRPAFLSILAVTGIASLYFGMAAGAYYLKQYPAAVKIYPCYTKAYLRMLPEADTVPEMERLADTVIKYNKSVSLAHSAKARTAFSKGDMGTMIVHKLKAIELAKYSLDEYLDYFDMLCAGAALYEKHGDAASALYCRERLLKIPGMLEEALGQTSPLGWKIDDKPHLELPEKYKEILKKLS